MWSTGIIHYMLRKAGCDVVYCDNDKRFSSCPRQAKIICEPKRVSDFLYLMLIIGKYEEIWKMYAVWGDF